MPDSTLSRRSAALHARLAKYPSGNHKIIPRIEIKDKLLQLGLSFGMKFESGLVESPMSSERSEDGKLVSF